MTGDDLDWVVEVTRQRRESLVPHAPRFWRPAKDATERHRTFLESLVTQPEVFSVRSDVGYLIALRHGTVWVVDDAVVTDEGEWLTDGVRLLRYARELCGPLRFVVPVFQSRRMEAAHEVGLAPVEHWWHRDLAAGGSAADRADSPAPAVVVQGAAGRLVPAPPIYDPGGPVLLVTEVDSAASLSLIEAEARTRGACVAVVSQDPTDVELGSLLVDAGYVLTTAFCEEIQP